MWPSKHSDYITHIPAKLDQECRHVRTVANRYGRGVSHAPFCVFEDPPATGRGSRTSGLFVNVSRRGSARKQRELRGGLRGLKKDLVLFDGETERESAGFGPEWGGWRSGGSFFWSVVGEGQEAQIPLETGEDACLGLVGTHSADGGGERV